MEDLNSYNDTILNLYKQGFSIDKISQILFGKINTKLKTFNKNSQGELWVSIPKVSKNQCLGHVYKVIYINKMKKNGGN